jgi:ATP-dependent exoDNAse (exonuclease V) beta subunit
MTRARNGLLLCGALGDDGKPVARSPLHLLWPSCRQFLDSPVDGNAPTSAEHDAPNTLEQARLTRLPLDWHRSPAPAPPAIAHASVVEVPAPLEFSWAGAAARAIGTVTHSALQHIAGDGVEHWSITRLDALESWLRAALHEQGLARGEVEPALATVRTALHATLQDARGRWLLSGEHTQAASELRLSACTGGAMQRVVIDRSFIADGTRWLVDYKTGQHHGGDVAGFVEREVERYRGQLESYGAIVAQDEPHPIKLGLYFPLLGAWREWDYRS